MRKELRALAGYALFPLVAYAVLLSLLDGRGAPTVMLGATAGSGASAIAAMAAALILRLYLVLVLPASPWRAASCLPAPCCRARDERAARHRTVDAVHNPA